MKLFQTYQGLPLHVVINMVLMTILHLLIACKNNNHENASKHIAAAITGDHDTIHQINSSPGNFHEDTHWQAMATNQTVLSGQQSIKPVIREVVFSIYGNGYISFDARRNQKIAMRTGGRIERLYARHNYQYIRKGQKLLELYSPELRTYIEDYLYVQKNMYDSVLHRKAKEKLLLLGVSPMQIREIDRTGMVPFTIPIYSAYEGYVLFNPSDAKSTMEQESVNTGDMTMSDGMNASQFGQATTSSDNSIREGMYVSKGQTLFWLNDYKKVWGILAFNKENERYIKNGQVAVISSELFPGQSFRSVIQFTEPVYQKAQKFTQVRIYIQNNKGMLKQNSLIKANVLIPGRAMMLPSSAVMYLGRVAIVWVQIGITNEGTNVFRSRIVQVGRTTGNEVEILKGLQAGDAVAKDASYLADSETLINYKSDE